MTSDVHTGDDVLEWLGTDDAARQARRVVRSSGLSAAQAVADDVLQDARVAVWRRMQRGPLEVENPGGYGTQVLKREVLRIIRGRYETDELRDEGALLEPRHAGPDGFVDPVGTKVVNGHADPSAAVKELDDLRVEMERTRMVKPWVISAMLSVVTLRAYPDLDLEGVPSPLAGATPDQALVWPALWFAGQRGHFPADGDDTRERNRKNQGRSRMIREVIDRYNEACATFGADPEADHG